MTSTGKLIILVLTFLALAASVDAQSPREQLSQMVEQLQKTPSDTASREKAIALAAEIKPAPVVPEDARRAFIRGNTAFASAKDPAGFSRAIERFEEASALAPWWADPYFNLAKACEGAQDFDRALRALTYYRATATTEADKRQALDLTYALEEKRDLKKADAASVAQGARFAGRWSRPNYDPDQKQWHDVTFLVASAADGALSVAGPYFPGGTKDVRLDGVALRFKAPLSLPGISANWGTLDYSAVLSADGGEMTLSSVLELPTADQALTWQKYLPTPDPSRKWRQN